VLDKIRNDVAAIFADPEFRERHIDRAGYTGVASKPAEFRQFLAGDLAYKQRLITTAGITAQ
jgi:tripartite-type tricarboxylate transporter receptor subunit TctC